MSLKNTHRRRALSAVSVLAIAATGVAWSGCGDSNEDKVNSAIDNATDQANSIADQVQSTVDEQLDQANSQADDVSVPDDVDQAVEDAQDKADKALNDAQDQAEDIQNQVQDAVDQAQGN